MNQSTEAQRKIIRYIIKSTPFGEAKEVVKDLCKIISSLNPQDEGIIAALRDHNEERLAVFRKDGDASNYVVSSILNYNEGSYIDQGKGVRLTVDQSTLNILSSEQVELPPQPTLDSFRAALEANLKAYLQSYFKDQLSGFYVMYTGDESNYTFYIGVSAKNINLPNFYTGDWVSKWELTSQELKGEVSIQAHYYEEGNVQLKNSNKLSESLNVTLNPEGAKVVVDALSALENKHQNGMEKVYDQMPDLFFKAMRRILPVTGTKFDWNVHAHKVAASLKSQ